MLHWQLARRALPQYGLDALRARRRWWRKRGETREREPEVEEEADSGPRVPLPARESTVLSGTTSVFFKFRSYSKFISSIEISRFCPEP